MTPALSVVVPTYNRADQLARTLRSLAAQRIPVEVIVADDGSSDHTRAVVERFGARYHFQPDEGFRAGAARNAGIRFASAPVVAFVDTGVLAGPNFATAHLKAHRLGRCAVIGTTYGYNPERPWPRLAEVVARYSPEEAVDRFGGESAFQDVRQPILAGVQHDLRRLLAPWYFCWTVNLSVRTADVIEVGGFDEEFRGWGLEDQDLGYRLIRHGVPIISAPTAWAIETPHERPATAQSGTSVANVVRFLVKHEQVEAELFVAGYLRTGPVPSLADAYARYEADCHALAEWMPQAPDDVSAELAAVDVAGRLLVLGCGSRIPRGLPEHSVLHDFDPRYARDGLNLGVVIRALPDSYDAVVVTSRLAGVWPRWGDAVMAEAHRVAPTVLRTFDRAGERAL